MSDKKSEQKKQSSSAVWSQIGREAKDKPVGQVSGLNRSIDSAGELSGADTADLQQTYGNSFLQRVVQMGGGGSEGESAENAPEGVANDITPVSRDAAGAPSASGGESDVETRINRSRGQGQSLPDGLRGQMEGKFGADFGGVKIHNDGESDQLNREMGAKAFTTGSDIYFQQGQYNPSSQGGQKLIAHELTHVVQQGGAARSSVQAKLEVSEPDDKFEKEAEQVAEGVMSSIGGAGGAGAGAADDMGQPATTESEGGMTSEAEDAADQAGVSTSQVDSLTERANEKVAEGEDPKEVAKGAQKQITGKGSGGKPGEAAGSMMSTEAKETESEAAKQKEEHDPDKITAQKAAPGIKKPLLPEEDQSEALQFDETAIEEPAEAPLLPNWGELAYGTVQLFAGETASTEMDWRQSHAANAAASTSAAAAGTSGAAAAPEAAESAEPAEPEPLDRDALIKDALVGGVTEGVVTGAADFLADTLIENATNNIPYADGWIQMANIASDPEGWAKGVKNTFSADNAAKTFGGWGDMSKETTTEGKVAFVLEKILGIIGWVEAINGFFQQMLQIGIAVLYLAWAIANSIPGGQPVAAAIMTVIKFLEMILKWLTLLGNILLMMKPPLQMTVMGLRIADLKKAEADPQTLLEKQASLRSTTSAFATGVTQRSLQTAKTKMQEKRLKTAESTEETRQKIRDMDENASDPDTGKTKAEMMDDFKRETGDDVNTEPKKESSGKKAAKTAMAILLGVNPDSVRDEFRGAKNSFREFQKTGEAFTNVKAINAAQKKVGDLDSYNQQKDQSIAEKNRLQNELDVALPAKKTDIDQRQQDLATEQSQIANDLSSNSESSEAAKQRHDTLVAEADVQTHKQQYAAAEEASTSKIREADTEVAAADQGRRAADAEHKQADAEQQQASREIDRVKQQLAELDQQAAQKKAAKKDGEEGESSDTTGEPRKAAEAELARLEAKKKKAEEQRDKARRTMDEMDGAKRSAEEKKQLAETTLAETKQKQQALEQTERKIQEFAREMETLASRKEQLLEKQRLANEQESGLQGERAKNEFEIEKAERDIAKNKEDLAKLEENWRLSKLGHEYLPEAGWQGTKQIFKGGEDHDFWASFKKDDSGPAGKPMGNFGAGGQRHGSGITGAFGGGAFSDKIWNYKNDIGAGDWFTQSVTDQVQIAVDFKDGPEGTATGPIDCFHLTPRDRFGDDSSLAPLAQGDSFPDQIRTILPKDYFTDPNFSIQANSVMVRYSDKRVLFTPTVSAYTEVKDEGAVGSGDDATGWKINKFVFEISYTKQEMPLATKEDDSGAVPEQGMLIQRQADDEDEDPAVKRKEGEAEILEQLPEPPEEAVQTINSSAVSYNAMVAEEYAMQMQMQEIQQMEQDNEAQKLEAAAIDTAVQTNQQAIEKHQQDTAQSQEAQKEMEEGAKQAEEPAKQGFDISQELSKLIQMLIQPLIAGLTTAGEESGSGNQSGGAGEVDKFGGMQGEAMDMATSTTAESQAQSRQWQGESAALSTDIKKQQGEYNQFGQMVGKQQDDLDSSADMLSDAQDTNMEGLTEIQDMMQDQEMEHEDSASEMDDWATEHQDMRLDLYEQLEADLAESSGQSEEDVIESELEELGL